MIPPSESGQLKAGLGAALGQILIAPTVITQALVSQFGSNLQAVVGLLNTTHTALYVKQNASLNAHANLLANISAAHATLLTNHTNNLLTHLDTHKEIAQNVSEIVVQAATALLNSTANLVSSSYQTHVTVAQLIINATLEAKLESMNATSVAHQTILRGVGTLLEQKMEAKQLFYGNISVVIQNITNATIFDLEAKINKTLTKLEYFDNKTLIACDALTEVMMSLTDVKNGSALSFVAKTTFLLDTIADIVNTTHNISTTFFANKTTNLLQSVGDVFDILANASAVRHEAFVSKFNTSVIAFTDAIVDVKEATGFYKANVTANFADKVANLMESKTALHTNVTRDLNFLKGNLTEKISIKVTNFTTLLSHKVPVATTRQAGDNLWFSMLGEFLENINGQFQNAVNMTTNAFQTSVQGMQNQIASVGQNAELTANMINAQLNATLQSFSCAQKLIPNFIQSFASSALEPLRCTREALGLALKTAMGELDEISTETRNATNAAIESFKTCRSSEDGSRCSQTLMGDMTRATGEYATNLATYIVTGLPNAFADAKCKLPENSTGSFENLQQQVQQCGK